jgi:hypothetical protein
MSQFEDDILHFQKIDKEFEEIILKSFRGLFLDGQGNSGPYFHAYISSKNQFFENTDYFYHEELDFFHLTSLENLLSILNSRSFRLYNLNSSKDAEEFKYAGNLLKLTEPQIQNSKEYLYTFSFCPSSELKNKKVWEIYGHKFTGAAIRFKIINDPKTWNNFHISNIKYKEPNHFNTYFQEIKDLEKKYGISASYDLSKLIAFHKMPSWNEEKEVRILTYYPYENLEEYLKYSKTEFRLEPKRNRVTHYIELPIWVDNTSYMIKSSRKELDRTRDLPMDYFDNRPQLKIIEIILGKNCGIEPESYPRFRTTLKDIVSFNFGYEIKIDEHLFSN